MEITPSFTLITAPRVIVAEALGETAIHSACLHGLFAAVDDAAREDRILPKLLVTILDDIFPAKELSTAAYWGDKEI